MAQTNPAETTPLRRLRLGRNLSLEAVAQGVGIHNSQLSRIERGGDTSKKTARAIVAFFEGAITEAEILCPEQFRDEGSPGASSRQPEPGEPTSQPEPGSPRERQD